MIKCYAVNQGPCKKGGLPYLYSVLKYTVLALVALSSKMMTTVCELLAQKQHLTHAPLCAVSSAI